MSTERPVTAVFDIGKTNKKFLLFDESFEVLRNEYINLSETEDEDGYPCENLELLVLWIREQMGQVLSDESVMVDALNISTYGASMVHLGSDGNPVTPLYNYLKPYPPDLQEQFYDSVGGRETFSLETATPPMGMLNTGLQIYWLKYRRPELFRKIRRTLHFPQYLSSLFTGEYVSDATSIGCHTGLWNFLENRYHQWIEHEEVKHLLPEMRSVFRIHPGKIGNDLFATGTGIHDSSAALVPYLLGFEVPFLLLSTGTWNIAMNPLSQEPLTFEELERDCLCYLNIYEEPVKAARFFLGSEYAHQRKKIEQHFGRSGDTEPDPVIVRRLVEENDPEKKLILEMAHTSGPYPLPGGEKPGEWDPGRFSSFEEAHHQLMLDLVSIQADSIRLAKGSSRASKLVVTGGFSRNSLFLQLLASVFPGMEVCTDSLSHASALGAAMVTREQAGLTGEKLQQLMELRIHKPLERTGVENYFWKPELQRKGR